jgi:hypothetical protein
MIASAVLSASDNHTCAQQTQPGAKYALLVGVTEYPRLTGRNLEGPANDVMLIKELLEGERFRVPAKNITVLAGLPADTTQRPTKANILAAMARLAAIVKRGDQVIILLAGHGSQQPDKGEKDDDEPDGLDEIFLPSDAADWSSETKEVTNAITDDEIRRAVRAFTNEGALVALIFDACQSGTMSRSQERSRQVPMEQLVPASEVAAAARRSEGSRGQSHERLMGFSDSGGQVAALYAAQMTEPTPEKRLPNVEGKVHGLFSYTIATILASSSTPLTYRELGQRVVEHYRALNRPGPTPMFEGSGLDHEFLGERSWKDRPTLIIGSRNTESGRWSVRGGSVHGLSQGTILEVFPPAGTAGADKAVGLLRLAQVTSTTSEGQAVERQADDTFRTIEGAPNSLFAPASRARVLFYDYGDLRLKVALQVARNPSASGGSGFDPVRAGAGPRELEVALNALEKNSEGLATRVESDEDADWLIRRRGDEVILIPGAAWQSKDEPTATTVPTFRVGSIGDTDLPARLAADVRRLARAQNLMKMASANPATEGLGLGLELLKSAAGGSAPVPVPYDRGLPELHIGEQLTARIKNTGSNPVDVTLLGVDGEYRISALFPPPGIADNRLAPGQTRDVRVAVGPPAGIDNLVAVGVAAEGPRIDLSYLQQTPLERAAERGGSRGPATPFEALMDSAMHGGVRGTTIPAAEHVVRIVSFRTVKAK